MSLSRRDVLRLSAVGLTGSTALLYSVDSLGVFPAARFRAGGLRGFCIDSVAKRGADPRYFDALAASGARIGRISFPFRLGDVQHWRYLAKSEDLAALDRILAWAQARQIGIVLDGDFERANDAFFWSNGDLHQSFVESWRALMRQFKDRPSLVACDLLNEPNPPWTDNRLEAAMSAWRTLASAAVSAIRAEGARLPVVLESVGGGQAIGFRGLVPLPDDQVVYSLHVYTPHAITHQKVSPAWPVAVPYPAGPEWGLNDAVLGPGGWNRSRLELALSDVIVFQKTYSVPIFVGEFSCVRWAPDGSALRYVSDCLDIFSKYGWSWCYHEFRGWPGWDAEIDSDDREASTRSPFAPVFRTICSHFSAVHEGIDAP